MSLSRRALAAIAACLLPVSAGAQEAGDMLRGFAFASGHFSECHAIAPAVERSPNPSAPTFIDVAKTKGMTGRALAAWLDTSHPTMPNFVLKRQDRDDVVAYILSLGE
jgi:mono/diheme cytochrome c family protein